VKALVVGGDGVIGRALSAALKERGDAVLRTTRRAGHSPGSEWMALDLGSSLPALPDCDVAFFCAAITGFAACRASPQMTERINVSAPVELADTLVSRGSRVILLSTSAVLDCAQPRMRADRPYAPRGTYGSQKAAAERGILMLGSKATVLRLSKVLTPDDERAAAWTRALREKQPVRAFHDHRISPITCAHAVGALLALTDKSEGGIYQASGADDLSYAELASELARRVGAPGRLVQPCPAASAGIPADEITPYTSLDSSRLEQLCGFVPPAALTVVEQALGRRVNPSGAS
jgi:dTDP-4-dehydrorhamnose reductase